MRPPGPKFWRIGGRSGWRGRTSAAATNVAVSDRRGVRLAAIAGGPLSLLSSDDSLGGLVLPRGMALDSSLALYVLGLETMQIRRFDGESRQFVPLPEVGGHGEEPRRFSSARNLAIARDWLYVADTGNQRVQVFDVHRLTLIEILEWPDWEPVDVAAHDGAVSILDARGGRVFRHEPGGVLEQSFVREDRAGKWSRIAVDSEGTVYVLNRAAGMLETSDPEMPGVSDAGAVRDRFEPPLIRLDEKNRFCLPASLARACGRSLPVKAPPAEVPLGHCTPRKPAAHRPARTAQGAWLLYVADREERRVDAYTNDGKRRHSWGAGSDWTPADVAAFGDTAYVLDEQGQAVHRHKGGREELTLLLRDEKAKRHWTRVASDAEGVYLWSAGSDSVQVFDCAGCARGERQYREVAALFEAERPPAPTPIERGLFFDRDGNPAPPVDFSDPSGTALYSTSGRWQSVPFDSQTYRCQWHRIELDLSSFPPGSRVAIATCAHEEPGDVHDPTRARFVDAHTHIAPIARDPKLPERQTFDCLVQSGPGRYLTIRLSLQGDGFSTPAVDAAKIHYPRDSYLQYLPATYSADDDSRVFLERFLAIFQTEWDALDRTIDESERFFDPDAVPDGPFLDQLAKQWLALPLEADWTDAQKRRLLAAAPKIYPHRGQLRGLRDVLAVYLANMTNLETEDVRRLGYPAIVEGFRERELLVTSQNTRLGGETPLWSASMKRRLQLGVFSREGEAALVSAGDPEHDVFAHYAHRFRVYMPASWVRTAANERMIRRAIDAEKPAQTQYELCLVGPRFRLDAQSTIGVDTILGDEPTVRLGCATCHDTAPAMPPLGRLGYDTVVCARGGRANESGVLA